MSPEASGCSGVPRVIRDLIRGVSVVTSVREAGVTSSEVPSTSPEHPPQTLPRGGAFLPCDLINYSGLRGEGRGAKIKVQPCSFHPDRKMRHPGMRKELFL